MGICVKWILLQLDYFGDLLKKGLVACNKMNLSACNLLTFLFVIEDLRLYSKGFVLPHSSPIGGFVLDFEN